MESTTTVLIRTYNSQDTVKRALDSVKNQSLSQKYYSILVVDDGSTDDSVQYVKEYDGVKIMETSHMGSLVALNRGLESVTTPFVIILDSDDWFEPTILEAMLDVLKRDHTINFVYSDYYEVVGETRKVVSVKDNIFNTIAAGIMFSARQLQQVGYYDESLIFSEYDLLIKLLPKTSHHHISSPLYNYVRHSRSITADKEIVRKGKEQLFEKYGTHYPIRDY
ncbi:MAG: glycosyltransferase family A protein [Candidatus Thorarchaeota archaeon]